MATTDNGIRHGFTRSLEMSRRLNPGRFGASMETTHGSLLKRDLRGRALAGTIVGVVVGVALVVFCLYPFVVYYIKRRRNGHRSPFDLEEPPVTEPGGHPDGSIFRLSSSDSFKQHPNLPRGDLADRGNKEVEWEVSHDGGADAQPPSSSSASGDARDHGHTYYRVKPAPFPLLDCLDGEFAPPMSEYRTDGILQGTSVDYYNPYVPSEALGMVDEPEPILETPTKTSSRGTAFGRNMMRILRRESTRDQLPSPAAFPTTEEPLPPASASSLQGATPMQPITTGDQVESPTNISLVSPSISRPPVAPIPPGPISPPSSTTLIHSESPRRPYQSLKKSPSPPAYVPPGTVNPMDIMPASTESEVWHRNEHQLFASSYEISPSNTATLTQPGFANGPIVPSPSPTPPETHPQPTFTVQSPDDTADTEFIFNPESPESEDVAMPDSTPRKHARHVTALEGRPPGYPSDQSTPLPSHAITDVSSLNTPSTQIDSPSPESVGSSDFRHSASPGSGLGAHSPRNGVFRCDEPGCNQVFDQPHKLKHHQRYHSKDHKCPYAGCGKGFGTKTHLQRHINDRHEKKKKFHCSIHGCDYSRAGGKAFPRKDNWKRHMTKIHNIDQQHLPEPIEVDAEMGGM